MFSECCIDQITTPCHLQVQRKTGGRNPSFNPHRVSSLRQDSDLNCHSLPLCISSLVICQLFPVSHVIWRRSSSVKEATLQKTINRSKGVMVRQPQEDSAAVWFFTQSTWKVRYNLWQADRLWSFFVSIQIVPYEKLKFSVQGIEFQSIALKIQMKAVFAGDVKLVWMLILTDSYEKTAHFSSARHAFGKDI